MLYDEFGGRKTCLEISTQFYARVAKDPTLRPFFGKSFTCAIEEFAAWVAQFLGGPPEHAERRWWLSLHESHRRFPLGPKHRDAWLACMSQTLEHANLPENQKTALRALFERSSAYLIDQPNDQPIPLLADSWNSQLTLDQAVAAIHQGHPAEPLVSPFRPNQPVFARLLALLIKKGQSLDFVDQALDSTLAQIPLAFGRTLLQEAAGAAQVDIVKLLLTLNASPKHVLHSMANECRPQQHGAQIVHILAHAGADVNYHDTHQQTTPLHMAARQGFTGIAQALIDCGAHINARDRKGETPLKRALNCRRPQLAELLRAHNATI